MVPLLQASSAGQAAAPDGCSQDGRALIGGGPSLQSLLKLSNGIDAFTRWTGKRLAWLILVAVVVSALNAIVRKVFDTSSNSWLELQWVLFSKVFLLCSPWTLLDNEHIRIDIINNMLPKRVRDSIDVLGHIFFLMPLTVVMIITGVPFFLRSAEIDEQSGNAGGLPQWPAKSLIMIGFAFLLVQGISELIKRIAIMRGIIPDPHVLQVHAIEAEVEHLVEAMEKH
jgi:TRAP-type mannitol/chloroaromatic compound transport system permease small subunit